MKQWIAPVGWASGMLVLILDSKTALAGAWDGAELCIRTLIPGLFPFFFLSIMLTSTLPAGALLLTGILGGYPVGARNVAQAHRAGIIAREDAQRLVVLCNCAGPSFFFGVVGPMFDEKWAGFTLWGIYLASVLILWALFPKSHSKKVVVRKKITVQQALWDALRAMAGVCGWVILFRVLLAIMDRWFLWLLPKIGQSIVYGIMELSNGCLSLRQLEPEIRFILAAGMLGFGGLCVMLQTASVAGGVSLKLYFPGKVLQGTLSMLLAAIAAIQAWNMRPSPVLLVVLVLTVVISGFYLRKSEKRCGNRSLVGV